jgi:signal transduction histidine kinase
MALRLTKPPTENPVSRPFGDQTEGYLVAICAVILCTLARYPLQSLLETRAPYAFYLPVVAFIAWRYGLRPAVASFSLGAALGTYLYVQPITMIMHKKEAISLVIFLWSCFCVALIGGANRKAHAELEEAREDLRKANQQLEERVVERTAALVEKNEELSSFTYTVAHDLRSAIRSMVVNARLLVEDEGEKLGADGRDQTNRLYNSAIRLSTFVDDLLQYARTGNRPIVNQCVDLSQVIQRQSETVELSEGAQPFQIKIRKSINVEGDPTLLALAMHNLIENSCKYRSPDRPLVVEFGKTKIDGETCLFVRDNGMGFDTGFAEKIFVPFERLHRYADIPGTGIGLANVRRIIQRHGGRIWAEGQPNGGAVFYFTLTLDPQYKSAEDFSSHNAVVAA